jgi:NhaA family Na+:H+ antiporter
MNVPPRSRGQVRQQAIHSALARDIVLPAQRFIHAETVGGLALIAASICALVWANLPFGNDSYQRFWHETIAIDLAFLEIRESLQHWVNDGLMAIFFFVVGLEIKRELRVGELSRPAQALLPAGAALGGMVAPALIFLSLNTSGSERDGWGIVIATDIAFAVGVLALLSRYVPHQARIFLLAVAIFDDMAAIAVIAIFFSDDLSWQAILVAFGIVGVMLAGRRTIVDNPGLFLVVAAGLWLAIFESGMHATIAGVVLAMLVPSQPVSRQRDFLSKGPELMRRYEKAVASDLHEEADAVLGEMEEATRSTEAPLERMERSLHPWSSLLVIPIFALANAGIEIRAGTLADVFTTNLGLGVLLGLALGKPLGIAIATFITTRTGLGELPKGVGAREVIGIGMLAGIGFTVSIFITGLALDSAEHIDVAKAAIFIAFIVSSIGGYLYFRLTPQTSPPD